jgi:hypothetical protein
MSGNASDRTVENESPDCHDEDGTFGNAGWLPQGQAVYEAGCA